MSTSAMGRLFGCYIQILVVWVAFSDVLPGMSATQFLGVGQIANFVVEIGSI